MIKKKIIVKIAFSAKPNRFYEIYTQNTSVIGTQKPICRHPLENTVTVTLRKHGSGSFFSGLGCRSRSEPGVFGSLEPEPEPLEKKQEPEPLGKKVRSRSR